MFNRRFSLCLIVVGLIAFPSVYYIGYRTYQNHVDFKIFLSKVLAFQSSLDNDHPGNTMGKALGQSNHLFPASQGIDAYPQPVKVRMAKPGEKPKWELPEYMRQQLKTSKSVTLTPENTTKQIVQTSDGKIHEVYVIRGMELKDGDLITEAILTRPRPLSEQEIAQIEAEALRFRNSPSSDKIVHFRKSDVPEGESIEMYGFKRRIAELEGVSMTEVNRMIATGETRIEMGPITDEIVVDSKDFLEKLGIEGASPESFRDESRLSDTPIPIESNSESLPMHPHSEDGAAHETTTAESVETELEDQSSPKGFDKARQLIDEYGTEEGLRRLREMDPDLARQFESDKSRPPTSRDRQFGREQHEPKMNTEP